MFSVKIKVPLLNGRVCVCIDPTQSHRRPTSARILLPDGRNPVTIFCIPKATIWLTKDNKLAVKHVIDSDNVS